MNRSIGDPGADWRQRPPFKRRGMPVV